MNFLLSTVMLGSLLVAAFFAGRESFHPATFTHKEVIDAYENRCGENEFMGECSECSECGIDEYAAGGCSYFKDTFCTRCTPILHCSQINVRCTTKFDHVCSQCDTHYWDLDCKPCTICPAGFFEEEACNQIADTVCSPCSTCSDDEFLSKKCGYSTDAECSKCSNCDVGFFIDIPCQSMVSVYELSDDTVCAPCSTCEDGSFVSDTCTVSSDTVCTECGFCPFGTFIGEHCVKGDIFKTGTDTQCDPCTPPPEKTGGEVVSWEAFTCGGSSDALYFPCSTCKNGEYEKEACTDTSDRVCADCVPMAHCKEGELRCELTEDERIHDWCEGCEEGFLGQDCCYQRRYNDCGTMTYKERVAKRVGFDGETNEDFISFCIMLCDEFSDCVAFEVVDGGSNSFITGDQSLVTKDATCYFKAAYSTPDGTNPGLDCYTNICVDQSHSGEISVVPQKMWRFFFKTAGKDSDRVALSDLQTSAEKGLLKYKESGEVQLGPEFEEEVGANVIKIDKNEDGEVTTREFENAYKLPGAEDFFRLFTL